MVYSATGDPLILEVKGNSLDDGPGIRTVVFFKGCPLSCVWCHNPESKRMGAELAFDPRECVSCDSCLEACPEGTLDRSLPGFVDRKACTLCFACVDACPSGALSRVGREMAVEEVLELVERDLPFFKTSGGGVTLSGGEPTLYMDYASRLLRGLKEMGVHTIVETCGHFDLGRFTELMDPYTDIIYYDLKIFDPEEHHAQCGVSNQRILANFRELHRHSLNGGTELLPRIPLIPGITATSENLKGLAGFLRETGARSVALLQYNPLWIEKSSKVGQENPLASQERMNTWMKQEDLKRCRDIFSGFTIT
jgi:pyruvate formate lyase activating enzyme